MVKTHEDYGMNEIWKPLMYGKLDLTNTLEISNFGNIRRIGSSKILKQKLNKQGYKMVCVSFGSRNKKKLIRIHRAVAFMFVDGYKEGLVVNHKDLIKTNNVSENLEWVTQHENFKHAYQNKDWNTRPKRILCEQTGVVFNSIADATKWCGIKTTHGIILSAQGRQPHSGRHPITNEKLSWKYV